MITGQIFDIKRYALHDGPGIRTTVFFKGCPMHCRWCHNPEGITEVGEIIWRVERCKRCDDCIKSCTKNAIIDKGGVRYIDKKKCDLCGDCLEVCGTEAIEMVGKEMTVDEVMAEIERDMIFYDESGGGVTFSGGEPLNQPEFLNSLLAKCKELDLHTTVDTSGYCSYQVFKKIQDKVDLFLFDLKCIDNYVHKLYTGVSNKIILENLKKLYITGNNILIRMSLIPGVNDDTEIVNSTVEFISGLKKIKEINLLPYHKMGIDKFKRLHNPEFTIESFTDSKDRIDKIKNKFEKNGISVKIGG
ncbi:MAG: glycyl-radical enzyme activating protein [bacterium]|nr:glycyl-radical enzyme activating protein [bacterium]